jgi:hypothetical protein
MAAAALLEADRSPDEAAIPRWMNGEPVPVRHPDQADFLPGNHVPNKGQIQVKLTQPACGLNGRRIDDLRALVQPAALTYSTA